MSCDSISSLPTLSFVLNGVQFPLSPSSYIVEVSSSSSEQGFQGLVWVWESYTKIHTQIGLPSKLNYQAGALQAGNAGEG